MKHIQGNRWLNIILITAAATVWVAIIFSLFYHEPDAFLNTQTPLSVDSARMQTTHKHTGKRYTYIADFRDPFKHWLWKKQSAGKKQHARRVRAKQPVHLPFSIQFNGMVNDKDGKMAMLEFLGRIHFLKEGQHTNGILVNRIYEDSVIVQYQKQRFTVK